MIRSFIPEDENKIVKIVKQAIVINEKDIIKALTEKDIEILVYENEEAEIQGFCYIKTCKWNETEVDLQLFVAPDARRKGIGTLLYNEIIEYIVEFTCIHTWFRADMDDVAAFYEKLGYKKWYGMHDLSYGGSKQPESDYLFVSYEDKYFEQYAEGLRSSFYEMRKVHDFQPHLCCELNDFKREELLNNKDNIFLLINDGILIASAIVYGNGFLDDIFVVPEYQGKGYGRIITQFAINKAKSKGIDKIETSVVEWNTKAYNLYKSLGFYKTQTIHYYRLLKE